MPDPIYLDHNATTPLLPEVVDAMLPFLRDHFGNPSSQHAYGQRARQAVDAARAQVAALIGAPDETIVFTSGGTEANNLAIRGVAEAVGGGVVTTAVEHPATEQPCAWLERRGISVARVGVTAAGQVDLGAAGRAIQPGVRLVTALHAHNETGVLQPISDLARLAQAAGAVTHTDAAQSVGKVPVDVDALGVDLLSIAGHKLYAPKGVGALYVRPGTPLQPLLRGAGHERGQRPGTESVAAIVALGAACAAAARDLDAVATATARRRDTLWQRLAAAIPGVTRTNDPAISLPNTLHLRLPGVSGDAVLARAPAIAASTGSACHAGHTAPPAVLVAMGVPAAEAVGAVRLTLGRGTTDADVEHAATALIAAWCSAVA